MAKPIADRNPLHQVTWPPTRPQFTIQVVNSTGRMCYSETTYEIISNRELKDSDFRRLDECGLLGIGQSYNVLSEEKIEDIVQPAVIDVRTRKVLPDVVPTNLKGERYTTTHNYTYHRYLILRICDSGD